MTNLSIWAKNNRVKTILLLVIFHFILWWIYFFIGAYIFVEDIILPANLKYLGLVLFFAAVIFHPIKNRERGIFKSTFFRRKFWQVTAMMSVAVFTILFGNHRTKKIMAANSMTEFSVQNIALDIRKNSRTIKKQERKQKRKIRRTLRKQIRKTVRKMRNAPFKYSQSQRIFFGILTILVALLLLYGLAILSCSIACSGAEGLAYLVAFGGLALVVYGAVLVFKKINQRIPVRATELD